MARVSCQACGGKTEEGAFCEKCGAPLVPDPAAAQPAEDEGDFCSAQPQYPASGDTLGETPTLDPVVVKIPAERSPRVIVLSPEVSKTRLPGSGPAEPRCADMAADADDFDDCPWLRVERDTVAFCVAGVNGLLRLRLAAQVEGLQDVCVNLYLSCVAGAAMQPVRWYRPKVRKTCEFSLTVPPLKEGAYAAELALQFVKDDHVQKYAANIELYVYPSGSSAKQIAASIVFNITNDIKMGHASDLHQSLDAASVLEKFTNNGQTHGVPELLDLLITDLRAFRRLCFNETGGGGVEHASSDALADRLTLRVGGQMLHLIAGNRVTFGRKSTNRITTRLFESAGAVDLERSRQISKYHCLFEIDDGECVIHDGAPDEVGALKCSSGGVFWQGKAVRKNVRFPVESFPGVATLGLAGEAAAPVFGLTAHGCVFEAARCSACENRGARPCRSGRIPVVLLRRTDKVPECYALLWACLDLGAVFPECAGLVVCHEQGAFSWRSSRGSGWLVPGACLAGNVDVRPFAQYGL